MSTLICCATYNRIEMSQACFDSFFKTVDPEEAKLWIVDNGSMDGTVDWLRTLSHPVIEDIVYNNENLGTAKALNMGWKIAHGRGWNAGKLDNDVVFYDDDWLTRMLSVLEHTENVGLVGVKRRDLEEKPNHKPDSFYRTWLFTLPTGQVIEVSNHVIGTCWIVSHRLLTAIGGLKQIGLYGLDDALYCHRAHIAGFLTVFVPDVSIEHIDPGDPKYPEYTSWKRDVAGEIVHSGEYDALLKSYTSGDRHVYEEFE